MTVRDTNAEAYSSCHSVSHPFREVWLDVLVLVSMVGCWQRQNSIRKGPRVDSNFSVFYVSVFSDSMPLCLYGSVSLCPWEERCSRDLWLYVGRISGISASKVPSLFAVQALLWSLVCFGTCSGTFSRTSSWTCPATFSRTFSGTCPGIFSGTCSGTVCRTSSQNLPHLSPAAAIGNSWLSSSPLLKVYI